MFREPTGPARSLEWLTERLGREGLALLVAEDAGALVGLVEVADVAAPASPVHTPRRYAVVDTLVVAQGEQRRGIGRALMDAAHAWATGRGLKQVQLSVWEFNAAARAFYEALGYDTLSRKLGRSLD